MKIQDKFFTFEYDYNAISDIEDRAGKGIPALFSEEVIGFNTLRLLVWGGLIRNNHGMTLQKAGNLIQNFIQEGNETKVLMEEIMVSLQKTGFMGKQSPGEEI